MGEVNLRVNAGVNPADIKSLQDLLASMREINKEVEKNHQNTTGSNAGIVDAQSIARQRELIDRLSRALTDLQNRVEQTNRSRRNEIGIINNLNTQLEELEKNRREALNVSDIQRYNREINTVRDQLNRLQGRTNGPSIGQSIMQGLGIGAGLGIAGAISSAVGYMKEFVTQSFMAAANFDQLKIAFSSMLGSNVQADKLLEGIVRFAQETPYAVNQLTDLSKQLLAFGFEADEIIPTLDMLGNVAAGVGKDRMPQLILAMGQIRSAGRLMGQDLLQLINAGFNPLQYISEKTGESMITLKKKMEEGKISFEMVRTAFKDATSEGGKFFNLMQSQTNTVAGQIDRLGDSFDQLKIAIGNQLQDAGARIIGMFGDLIETVSGWISLNPSEELEKQRIGFNSLIIELSNANEGESRRAQLIAELNRRYPEYLKNIDIEKASNGELLSYLNGVNIAIGNRIQLMARQEVSQDKLNKAVKLQNEVNQVGQSILNRLQESGVKFSSERLAQIQKELQAGRGLVLTTEENIALRKELGEADTYSPYGALQRQVKEYINTQKELSKATKDAASAELSVVEAQTKIETDKQGKIRETTILLETQQKRLEEMKITGADPFFLSGLEQAVKNTSAELAGLKANIASTESLVKPVVADSGIKNTKETEKRIKEAQKLREELDKIIGETSKLGNELIADEYERRIAVLGDTFTKDWKENQKLRKEILSSSLSPEEKNLYTSSLDLQLQFLSQIYEKDVNEIWKQAEENKSKILKEGLISQLTILNDTLGLEYARIEEVYKKHIENLKAAGMDASIADEWLKNEKLSANVNFQLKQLEEEEKFALASINIVNTSGTRKKEIEKGLAATRLLVQQDYSRRKIETLRKEYGVESQLTDDAIKSYQDYIKNFDTSSGFPPLNIFDFLNIEFDLTPEQKSRFIQQFNDAMAGITATAKESKGRKNKLGIISLLGFDSDLTDQERQVVARGLQLTQQMALESFKGIMDARAQAVNDEIALIDKRLDKMREAISEQESIADREKQLAEDGYANNYAIEQQKLNDLKAQEAEQLAVRQEATNKLIQIQKQQAIADYALSTASMIAASAGVIKDAVGQMGWIGAIVGVATAGAMVAGFFALQSQLKSLDNQAQMFRDGGALELLNGQPSHEQGGVGLYNEVSGRKIAEFEGNESLFVVNKGSTAKFRPLLSFINDNDEAGMVDYFLNRAVLNEPLIDATLAKANEIKVVEYRAKAQEMNFQNEDLKDIARTNRRMYEIELYRKSETDKKPETDDKDKR